MDKDKIKAGFFIINKPRGITSHDVVATIRRILKNSSPAFRSIKVGHTGTLDPMATGVMIVPIGTATRLIQFTHNFPKTYQASMTLGGTSTTDDTEGTITPSAPITPPIQHDVETSLTKFVGDIEQTPPIYSAIKIEGKKLYDYARQGKEVKIPTRHVTIHSLRLIRYAYPNIAIESVVSTGTYIRSLARDIGHSLGTGAYLSALHRSAIGIWADKEAVDMDNIQSDTWMQYLQPVEKLIPHLPTNIVDEANIVKIRQGRAIPGDTQIPQNTPLALYSASEQLIGIGTFTLETSTISPVIVLAQD